MNKAMNMMPPAAPKRVTLARVAGHAGVSTTTASLILSGRSDYLAQFSNATIERVRRVADELGYRANLFASSLHSKGSSFFAMVLSLMEHRDPGTWLYRAFDGELLAGAIREARNEGVYPVVGTACEVAGRAEVRAIEGIMAGGVFGSIVRTPSPEFERCIRERLDLHTPIVVVFPSRVSEWESNTIDVDNIGVGRLAGKAMLQGARPRKWLFVHERSYYEGRSLRQRGFEQVADEAGIEMVSMILDLEDADENVMRDALLPIIRELRPDGIFAPTLAASVGSLMASMELGIDPRKGEIRIVGCDCTMWPSGSLPRLTGVDVSWADVGALAVRKLIELKATHQWRFDNILMQARINAGETCPEVDTGTE